jgi:glycosyltransferase involved in cell wall biosynthesis
MTVMNGKRLAIIMPSYNDSRIAEAIASVRRFDDIDTVRLVIIDGGSNAEVIAILKGAVRPGDILVSEPDGGIFDALNKGLDRVDTEFMGWLGSDDLFTGQVMASDVVRTLETNDVFVSSLAMFRDDEVRRIFDARIVGWNLVRFGLHNPHYSTFGRSATLTAHRFSLVHKGSDIEYFVDVFGDAPRVATTGRVGVAMREGGYSNQSRRRIADINLGLFPVYRARIGMLGAVVALGLKLGWKIVGRIAAIAKPRRVSALMIKLSK